MKKSYRNLLLSLCIVIIGYSGVCLFFYFVQNEIIFHPQKLETDFEYSYTFPFEERYFETEKGIRIHAIHALADSARGLVLYFHGNARNNNTDPAKFELFLSRGYDVLYPDYRGFGKSSGKLHNEQDLVGDMKTVYREVLDEYPEEYIVVLGYSLGSGVAAQVAAANDPGRLILWAPYYSMLDMKDASYAFLPDFLLRYPLRTDRALQQVEEPVSIFYAGKDRVLPVERSLALRKFLKKRDQYFILESQSHGGIYYNQKLVNLMDSLLSVKSDQ